MPSSKRKTEELRAMCARIHSDDDIDPREHKECRTGRTAKRNRKLRQLCKQITSELQLILPTVEALAECTVVDVLPAPNAGRLRVIVTVPDMADYQRIVARLEQCGGYLRCRVAQAVTRRRVPELVFTVINESKGHE